MECLITFITKNFHEIWVQEALINRLGNTYNYKKKKLYLDSLLDQKKNQPISRLLGFKYFWDYKFYNKNVLDPRWDSEILVETCVSYAKKLNKKKLFILDLGTGSGCLVLSVMKILTDFGFEVVGLGIDISPLAIKTAEKNKKSLGVENCVFVQGDWWNFNCPIKMEEIDLVLCNPPYISVAEIKHVYAPGDPENSLFALEDGMADYEKIIKNTPKNIGAYFFFEVSHFNFLKFEALLKTYSWQSVELKLDLEKRERCFVVKNF